ncbi:rho-related BTB domain-containing protein 3 [Spea bombifrons]|uniref:rho-related BTB domain-containing protein 3 n=1 Tax=Spea bombifrons TaxID=233779 RepID=UPI00234A8254|nr:rho-related BTB domain-containing protein 3 [Spea bombifrons]
MSVCIVLLGKERNSLYEDQEEENLASFYLRRRAAGLLVDDNHPVFTLYRATVFGTVQIVAHECLSWDVFDRDKCSQNIVGEADVIVLKYSVNDRASFLDIKDHFAPLIKQKFQNSDVPVIVSAIGTANNDGPFCTCPLCSSDRGTSVTSSEGIQLAKYLGATFLELQEINDFFVRNYFGGMLEYFILESFKKKSTVKGKKKKKHDKCLMIKAPKLDLPEQMPVLKEDPSQYESDLQSLLVRSQCVDVIFYNTNLEQMSEAHRIVLCSVSCVFMLLFGEKPASDIDDPAILRTARALFSECREDMALGYPVRVIVKDSLFCSCLSDILHFIYSGARNWGLLEQCLKKKMSDPRDASHVLHRVQCILKVPGNDDFASDLNLLGKLNLSNSLGRFFNTNFLADVIFHVQDVTIPAHRAVLLARCEVMAAMFSGSYVEAKSLRIPVYGISKDTFLIFLEYLYTDACHPESIQQGISLLICSEMYQVPRLQQMCECYITNQLQNMSSRELAETSLSVVHLLRNAKFHNSDGLSNWLLYFIASNYLIFSRKRDFQDLSDEERAFIDIHRWPSSVYLKQLAEYRRHMHSQKHRCAVM